MITAAQPHRTEETMTYRTGQIVELHTPAHPYYDAQIGYTDHSHILPATTEQVKITRVAHRGDDVRLTLRRADNTGFGIFVNKWLAYAKWGRTIRIVA
jgi:hypothetical protein